MKQNQRQTPNSPAAKTKSAAPTKMSNHAKEERSQPRQTVDTTSASKNQPEERGVIVGAPPDKQGPVRKRN